MRNKKITLSLLFVLSFTLTACTLQDLPLVGKYFGGIPEPSGSITFWGLWENPEVISSAITAYKEERTNVQVTYDDRSILKPADYKERIFARAKDNVGADVIFVHNSWVSKLKGDLAPMPDAMASELDYANAFYPVAAQSAVFDGKVYAVPFYYDGLVLLYNKDHFAEIGQQEPPTSWEEFRRVAGQLTIKAGEDGEKPTLVRAGAAMGTVDNIEHFSDILGLLFTQTDVQIPDELQSDAAADALTFYTNFVREDQVWDSTFPEANDAFAQGKVSMIFVPSWRILDLMAANPELNFGVAPVPQPPTVSPAAWASFWMLAVPATSANPSAAWDFINFITSENQELAMFNASSQYRPFGAAFARKSLAPQISSDPYLGPVVATAPYAKSAEIAGRSGNDSITTPLGEAVNAVVAGKVTSAQAIENFMSGNPQPAE
jgi:multiple sugar transport system substrate-binding protein